MTAALDVGNTNIVLAISDGGKWISTYRVFSDQKKTSDEYRVIFSSLLKNGDADPGAVDKVIISSVVPNLTLSMQKVMSKLFGVSPFVVSRFAETGLDRASIPAQLGSDLLCNLAWAHHVHPDKYVMTVDFGTALTFSTVSPEGEVKGVAIVPGLLTGVNALFGSTAQLPQAELSQPESCLGRNSEDSIRAGMMFGYAGLVERLIRQTSQELEARIYVMATGGLCQTIAPMIPLIDSVDKFHTLNGLRLLAQLNSESKDSVFEN